MVGSANAFNQGISGATNAYYQNQMLNLLKDKNPNSVSSLSREFGPNNVYGSGFNNYSPGRVADFSDMGGSGFYPQ
jgi:hypothetical protein